MRAVHNDRSKQREALPESVRDEESVDNQTIGMKQFTVHIILSSRNQCCLADMEDFLREPTLFMRVIVGTY